MVLLSCIFTIGVLLLQSRVILASEMIYDHVQLLNTSYSDQHFNFTVFRIAKFNRTTYASNGELIVDVDFDGNFSVDLSFHYNRFNNNQYNKSPMRVVRESSI